MQYAEHTMLVCPYVLLQLRRQQSKHKFFMRTPKGQPLMKFRMEKILSTLQSERKAQR